MIQPIGVAATANSDSANTGRVREAGRARKITNEGSKSRQESWFTVTGESTI